MTKRFFLFIFLLFLFNSLVFAQHKRYFYTGTIDNKYDIGFDISFDKNTMSGKYFYNSQSKFLWINGKITKDGKFTLLETDEQGKSTGSFSGFTSKDHTVINGYWISKDKKKALPMKVVINAFYKEVKHNSYNVSVEYPIFSINDQTDFKEVDKAIYEKAKLFYNSNLRNFEETIKEVTDVKEMEKYSFNSSINVRFSDNLIKSLSVIHDEYTGGAHPNYYFSCMTFDKGGDSVSINSVINVTPENIKIIDKIVIDDLRKKEATWIVDESLTSFEKELAGNSLPYLFSSKGIEFYISPYIAGPYAQGSFIAMVPYTKIKSIILADSKIKHLIK